MMRSDSDLDETESVHVPTTPENIETSSSKEEAVEESELTTTTEDNNKVNNNKKEWRKLWRSQKTYWREREINQTNDNCDERDEVEQNGESTGDDKKDSEEEGPLSVQTEIDSENTTAQEEGESSASSEDSKEKEKTKAEIFASQSPKGWRLLKRLQKRHAAQALEQELDQEGGSNPDGENGQQQQNNEEESALWRNISFTIGSLTDDENGVSTDEDLNKSLDDIEEQILREAGIENNSENEESGVIPPSPWSSLRRLREKIKENSASTREEEVDFVLDEAFKISVSSDDGDNDESRDEAGDAPMRTWASLKRLRGRIREGPSTNKEEQNAEGDVKDDENIDVDDSNDAANGEEVEAPSPWSSLKRLRDRIKENTDTEEGSEEPTDKKEENGEETTSGADESDNVIENGEETDEIGDEANTKRWGVLDRLRKKLDTDNNDSIEAQIESLAKELEKEQQRPAISSKIEIEDENADAEEETEEDQERNNGQRKGWTLFKRVQDRLTSEKTVDDEEYGYENVDEVFAYRTFHVLHARNQELEDLVERLQRSNEILKAECKLNNVKVTELTNIIEKKDDNLAEDILLHKSIENAELLMQVDELQVELDKANSSVQNLKTENREHKRLIAGMGRVLDALHSAHVDDSSEVTSSMGPSGELSIDDLEPKIERIMEDREQLVLRCTQLERENELKDEEIEKLSEALDAQSFHYGGSVEKAKEDDQSVQSELTRSTYTGTSVSSSSIESEDYANSRLRNLYNTVSSKMTSGNMESVQENDNPYFDTKALCDGDDDDSSINAIQGQNDELESIKKRLNKSDPKYVEFLSLMDKKGMTLESVPSGEAEERPSERPEQETTSSDEIICELVI